MRKSQIAPEEVLDQFMARLAAALRLAPAGSAADPTVRAQHFKKALQSSGITHAVAADVLDVPSRLVVVRGIEGLAPAGRTSPAARRFGGEALAERLLPISVTT